MCQFVLEVSTTQNTQIIILKSYQTYLPILAHLPLILYNHKRGKPPISTWNVLPWISKIIYKITKAEFFNWKSVSAEENLKNMANKILGENLKLKKKNLRTIILPAPFSLQDSWLLDYHYFSQWILQYSEFQPPGQRPN